MLSPGMNGIPLGYWVLLSWTTLTAGLKFQFGTFFSELQLLDLEVIMFLCIAGTAIPVRCSVALEIMSPFFNRTMYSVNSDGILVQSRACVCSLHHNIVTYSLPIPNPFLWDALQQCGVPCLYIYVITSFSVPSFNFETPLVTPHILFHLCSSQSSLYLNHYAQSNFRRKNNFRSYFLKFISCPWSKWWGR